MSLEFLARQNLLCDDDEEEKVKVLQIYAS